MSVMFGGMTPAGYRPANGQMIFFDFGWNEAN
jgi:hypothetical protein